MAALNYYLGVKSGDGVNPGLVQAGTSSVGTAVDVEVRLQINDGSQDTSLTKLRALIALESIERFIESNGLNAAGANLPPL